MNNDIKKEDIKAVDEPIVIPDECGDSMWDEVLDQSPFVQALRKAGKEEPKDKKDKVS